MPTSQQGERDYWNPQLTCKWLKKDYKPAEFDPEPKQSESAGQAEGGCLRVLVVVELKHHQIVACRRRVATLSGSYNKPDGWECWRQEWKEEPGKCEEPEKAVSGKNHFCGKVGPQEKGCPGREERKRELKKQDRIKELGDDRPKWQP